MTVRAVSDGFELVVGDDVIHKAGSEMEARAVVPWIQSQIATGVSPKNVGRLLRGESVKSAEGGSGESADGDTKPAAKKPAAKKPAAKAAAKKPAASKPAGADLSILGGSVGKVKAALATGSHDGHLDELLKAEKAGKARKGAIEAIEARKA